jgi:hypothetical protein
MNKITISYFVYLERDSYKILIKMKEKTRQLVQNSKEMYGFCFYTSRTKQGYGNLSNGD